MRAALDDDEGRLKIVKKISGKIDSRLQEKLNKPPHHAEGQLNKMTCKKIKYILSLMKHA